MVSSSVVLYLGLLSLSLTEPGAHLFPLDRLAHGPTECLFLCFLALGFRLVPAPTFSFHVGARDWNSGPNPCPVRALPAGPCSSLLASNPPPLTPLRQGLSI